MIAVMLLKSDIKCNCVIVISPYKRTLFSRDHVFIARIDVDV